MFTDCCLSKVPLNFGLVGLKKRSNVQFRSFDSYVTFIPGIMNFIDDEEQPLFLILKVYFIVKLYNQSIGQSIVDFKFFLCVFTGLEKVCPTQVISQEHFFAIHILHIDVIGQSEYQHASEALGGTCDAL